MQLYTAEAPTRGGLDRAKYPKLCAPPHVSTDRSTFGSTERESSIPSFPASCLLRSRSRWTLTTSSSSTVCSTRACQGLTIQSKTPTSFFSSGTSFLQQTITWMPEKWVSAPRSSTTDMMTWFPRSVLPGPLKRDSIEYGS